MAANGDSLGMGSPLRGARREQGIEYVMVQRPLDHIFSFTGFTIDDVVNDPIARNTVLGYFKLDKQITRTIEIVDLERQWNR